MSTYLSSYKPFFILCFFFVFLTACQGGEEDSAIQTTTAFDHCMASTTSQAEKEQCACHLRFLPQEIYGNHHFDWEFQRERQAKFDAASYVGGVGVRLGFSVTERDVRRTIKVIYDASSYSPDLVTTDIENNPNAGQFNPNNRGGWIQVNAYSCGDVDSCMPIYLHEGLHALMWMIEPDFSKTKRNSDLLHQLIGTGVYDERLVDLYQSTAASCATGVNEAYVYENTYTIEAQFTTPWPTVYSKADDIYLERPVDRADLFEGDSFGCAIYRREWVVHRQINRGLLSELQDAGSFDIDETVQIPDVCSTTCTNDLQLIPEDNCPLAEPEKVPRYTIRSRPS